MSLAELSSTSGQYSYKSASVNSNLPVIFMKLSYTLNSPSTLIYNEKIGTSFLLLWPSTTFSNRVVWTRSSLNLTLYVMHGVRDDMKSGAVFVELR